MPGSTRRPVRRFFRALPAYLGGKRRLTPLIFGLLAEQIPRQEWSTLRFGDPCCGGGAVALTAKAQGFTVAASDVAERAVIVARALVANPGVRLRAADWADLYREPAAPAPARAAAFVPRVFTAPQAAWIDRALARAGARAEPQRSLLQLLILKAILRLQPMSLLTGTDAAAAAAGEYDRVSPRRLRHYLQADRTLRPAGLRALAADINGGVFGGCGSAERADAPTVLARGEADIVYLDPPYAGTTRYERAYAVLDALLDQTDPWPPPPRLDDLLDAARTAPLLILSYGGPTITLDDLVAQVQRHRPVRRALAVPYPHLPALATAPRKERTHEYLVVAG